MTATIRDIAIIFLAVETIIIGIILVLLFWQIRNLVKLLREEVSPLVNTTQETADTIQATTQFVSKRIVKPGVDALSFVAGVRQSVNTLKKRVGPEPQEQAPWEQTVANDDPAVESEPSSPTPFADDDSDPTVEV